MLLLLLGMVKLLLGLMHVHLGLLLLLPLLLMMMRCKVEVVLVLSMGLRVVHELLRGQPRLALLLLDLVVCIRLLHVLRGMHALLRGVHALLHELVRTASSCPGVVVCLGSVLLGHGTAGEAAGSWPHGCQGPMR